MPVNFDIKGKGQCNIEVQLNKKDNDEFNKIKSQCIILDLNKVLMLKGQDVLSV